MNVFRLIANWWRNRQRSIDLQILWPICCEQAADLDHAKMVFAVHAFNDPAWLSLGNDGIKSFIDNLEAPQ